MNEGVTPWWDSKGKLQYGGGSDPSQRVEYLLTAGKKPWQKKLFENEGRSVDTSSRLNYLRYPLELLNTPSHMSAMVFEIHDTNPTHLNTARTRLGKITESTMDRLKSQVKAAEDYKEKIERIKQSKYDRNKPGSFDGQSESIRGPEGQILRVIGLGDTVDPITGTKGGYRVVDESKSLNDRDYIKIYPTLESAGIGSDPAGEVNAVINNLVGLAGGAGGLAGDIVESVFWGSENTVMTPIEDPAKKVRPSDFTGYRGDSFVEEVTGFKNNTKDVGTRIYLYLPNNIESEYGFEYEDTNMSALDIARLAKVVSESGNQQLAAVVGRKLAMSNVKTIEGLAKEIPVLGSAVEDGSLSKFVEAQSRQIANPMAMHLFKEVKRREFTFAYTFLPKSVEEMLNCYRIIHQFKYYAHPATSGHGRFLDYPAEFHIKFYQKSSENKDIISGYLPYIFKCALKGIKVTYGEDSVMSTFMPDIAGAPPTKIGLELQFSELEILTRDRFGDSEWMPGINLPQP